MEDARDRIAALVDGRSEAVILTSGGTEANALGLLGPGGLGVGTGGGDRARRVIVGATEHPCILKAAPNAATIAVDHRGVVDLDHLESLLARESAPAVVGVMLANNETGVLQPVSMVADLCRRHGAWFHCDAVQGPGRLAVSLENIGCDSLALSGHKLGAPAGVGALVLAPGREVAPILRGGGQERGRRAGTENVLGTVGFGVACALVREEGSGEAARCAILRDRLESQLRARFPALVVHGEGVDRLPNTSCLGLPGLEAQRVLMALDLKGVRIGAGSACSSGSLAPSPVLLAMGLGKATAKEAIRVSLGWSTTEADVDRFLDGFSAVATRAMV